MTKAENGIKLTDVSFFKKCKSAGIFPRFMTGRIHDVINARATRLSEKVARGKRLQSWKS
jgi:hypothetical protein